MFVKQAGKTTFLETFKESIKVEKKSMTYDHYNNSKSNNLTHRRTKFIPKQNFEKKDPQSFDVE